MEQYLFDKRHNITGYIKEEYGKKYILYDNKYNNRIGYYDETKDQTYDFYGKLAGEGNLLQDLLYMPRKLKFPLPGPEQVSFTKYELEKYRDTQKAGNYTTYWDDGICKICRKNAVPTCHIQGLPGMCKTCYKFFAMYSQKDDFGLELKSRYHPITVHQIQEATEKTKAPFIAASKAADKAAKAALFNAFTGTLDAISDSLPDARQSNNYGMPTDLTHVQKSARQNTKDIKPQKKKKKRLSLKQWVLVVLLLYTIIKFLIPLVLFVVMLAYKLI